MLKEIKIGNLRLPHNIFLAPLAGITNLPFRLICRSRGASLAFTEMVSVNGLVRDGAKTRALLKRTADDYPLGIQLFGSSPDDLAEAARMVEGDGELIDINMGCPVKKVVGTGAGSALLRDLKQVAAIIRATRRATCLPLTVKIRSGWHSGEDVFLEAGKIAESEGCDAITLHPRSRNLMFGGHADWDKIRELKEFLSIPVIGSGDLFSGNDCIRMLRETACDGIMIARGALGAPWIFSDALDVARALEPFTPSKSELASTIRTHFGMYVAHSGEAIAVREMKKHIGWYAKGFAGASKIRSEAGAAASFDDIIRLIDKIELRETHGGESPDEKGITDDAAGENRNRLFCDSH